MGPFLFPSGFQVYLLSAPGHLHVPHTLPGTSHKPSSFCLAGFTHVLFGWWSRSLEASFSPSNHEYLAMLACEQGHRRKLQLPTQVSGLPSWFSGQRPEFLAGAG